MLTNRLGHGRGSILSGLKMTLISGVIREKKLATRGETGPASLISEFLLLQTIPAQYAVGCENWSFFRVYQTHDYEILCAPRRPN